MAVWLQSGKKAAASAVRHGTAVHHHSPLLHWLLSLGGVGLFLVAILDSSVIPLPLPGSTDLLLLILASRGGTTKPMEVLLAFLAFAGSMIGGYLCWSAGRKGGEVALERYVPKRILRRITGWVERRGALSVGISAILPPPVPLTPVVLAAGALKVQLRPFLIYLAVARAIRYGVLTWLGYEYGRRIVTTWEDELSGWSTVIIVSYLVLLVAGIAYAVWKVKYGNRASGPNGVQTGSPKQPAAPAEDVA